MAEFSETEVLNYSSPGAQRIGLGDLLNRIIRNLNHLQAKHDDLVAKLDADKGVKGSTYKKNFATECDGIVTLGEPESN